MDSSFASLIYWGAFIFMKKEVYLYSLIVCLLASVVAAFFNWRISTGIIIGAVSSVIYLLLLNATFKIKDGKISKGGVVGFFARILVLALPLLIACLLPNYFNVFAVFGAIMVFRIIMMIMFFRTKEGIEW